MNSQSSSVLCASTSYQVRLAEHYDDLLAAQRLRFEVFNLELHEGLDSAYLEGLDSDPFDTVCDHLLVYENETDNVVGTYRLQTGFSASGNLGYYSANEFEFAPFEKIRGNLIELGRACVAKEHRSMAVINLLWRGIGVYAHQRGGRYLIGCSSLSTQNEAVGWSAWQTLAKDYLAAPEFRTTPLLAFQLKKGLSVEAIPLPRLLRAYLFAGAKVCGPPAIDREFRTIDFLTLMDLENVAPRVKGHFLP